MGAPNIPNWVINLCCIAPFAALLIVALSGLFGGAMNFVGLVCLTTLCGKILQWLLNPQQVLLHQQRIGE